MIFLIVSFLLYLIITQIVDIFLLGSLLFKISHKNDLQSYMIVEKNRIDIQTDFQCAAFSCAYVLRHFDVDTDGNTLYLVWYKKS